ncbi:MAG TPA: hypothetical protein VGE31_00230 [Candidatus Paceibacterota bacterium]
MNVVNRENFWPTVASVMVPLVQLVAVIIVDVSNTLKLSQLFLNADILPFANLISLTLVIVGIGFFWYWKEHYNWFHKKKSLPDNSRMFHHEHVKNFLLGSILFSIITSVVLVASIVLGKVSHEYFPGQIEILTVIQIVCYMLFVSAVGIVTYIGLSEYSKKQKDFKPEHFLDNLLLSMQNHGIIHKPQIHIRQRSRGQNLQMSVNVQIDGRDLYLSTSYDGKDIYQEMTADEYRQQITEPTS